MSPLRSEVYVMKSIRNLKKGDYFTLKEIEYPNETQVWVRDIYDPTTKTFICYNFSDINRFRSFKGSKMVFDDEHFIF